MRDPGVSLRAVPTRFNECTGGGDSQISEDAEMSEVL